MTTTSGLADSLVARDQFLTLFARQLQYQNPTSPTDTDTFLQQLAQFSTVEGIQHMRTGINGLGTKLDALVAASGASEDANSLQAINAGASLLGKSVQLSSGTAAPTYGVVSEIRPQDGNVLVRIGSSFYPISSVVSVAASPDNLSSP